MLVDPQPVFPESGLELLYLSCCHQEGTIIIGMLPLCGIFEHLWFLSCVHIASGCLGFPFTGWCTGNSWADIYPHFWKEAWMHIHKWPPLIHIYVNWFCLTTRSSPTHLCIFSCMCANVKSMFLVLIPAGQEYPTAKTYFYPAIVKVYLTYHVRSQTSQCSSKNLKRAGHIWPKEGNLNMVDYQKRVPLARWKC